MRALCSHTPLSFCLSASLKAHRENQINHLALDETETGKTKGNSKNVNNHHSTQSWFLLADLRDVWFRMIMTISFLFFLFLLLLLSSSSTSSFSLLRCLSFVFKAELELCPAHVTPVHHVKPSAYLNFPHAPSPSSLC